MQTPNIVTLDFRSDFRAGLSPCQKIKGALSRVTPEESLRLLVPFEPVPLFELAAAQGLTHSANCSPEGDWEILFTTASVPNPPTATAAARSTACGCGCASAEPAEVLDVDARGLEPPQPMVKILEAIATLPSNTALSAHTDRRPLHLYPMLEARGYTGESKEQSDGSFVTYIRRA